ncbi:MAG: LPXTG cell wall anchor domain-containing protein [Corynebacteriales bacterium]|nr:LPXTG cell wall anchor domain-containing protein [Mycobacteriales bacterium]
MFHRSPSRVAQRIGIVVCGLVAAVTFATAQAQATDSVTVPLHAPHVGSTAAGFGQKDCSDFAPAPTNGQDGWHFVLPGKDGTFTQLQLTFTLSGGGQLVVTLPGANGYIKESNPKHAYVYTPAGATLAAGTAQATGDGKLDKFVLSHTCPTKPGQPTPSVSPTPSATPSVPSTSTEAPTPSASLEPTQPGGAAGNKPDTLPITGSATNTVLLGGVVVLAIGLALVISARRRARQQGV